LGFNLGLSPFDPPQVLGKFGFPPDVQNRVFKAPHHPNPCGFPPSAVLLALDPLVILSVSLSPFFTSPGPPSLSSFPSLTSTPPPAGGPRSRGLAGWRRRCGEAQWWHDEDGAARAPLQPGGRSRLSSGAEQTWRAELQEQGVQRRSDPAGPSPASPCGGAGHRRGRTPSGRG
jgi:hypothetical protein